MTVDVALRERMQMGVLCILITASVLSFRLLALMVNAVANQPVYTLDSVVVGLALISCMAVSPLVGRKLSWSSKSICSLISLFVAVSLSKAYLNEELLEKIAESRCRHGYVLGCHTFGVLHLRRGDDRRRYLPILVETCKRNVAESCRFLQCTDGFLRDALLLTKLDCQQKSDSGCNLRLEGISCE